MADELDGAELRKNCRERYVSGGRSFENWASQRDREGFLGRMAKGLQNQSDRFYLARPGGQEVSLFSISLS